jgi:hypothetical protein
VVRGPVANVNRRRERQINYRQEAAMLLLFKGPYRIAAKVVIGIALLVVGIVGHATVVAVIGGALIVWALYDVISGRRPGNSA